MEYQHLKNATMHFFETKSFDELRRKVRNEENDLKSDEGKIEENKQYNNRQT